MSDEGRYSNSEWAFMAGIVVWLLSLALVIFR